MRKDASINLKRKKIKIATSEPILAKGRENYNIGRKKSDRFLIIDKIFFFF